MRSIINKRNDGQMLQQGYRYIKYKYIWITLYAWPDNGEAAAVVTCYKAFAFCPECFWM